MKIAKTADYDATPEQAFAVLSDPAFQEAKLVATHAISHSATVEVAGTTTVIRTERVLPTHDLPDIAKSFVGDTLTVIETQEWGAPAADGSRSGVVKMDVPGQPLTLNGTLSLRVGGRGTVESVEGDLKARIPIIGGKIEKVAAVPIQEAIDIETSLLAEWLSR